MRYVLKKTTPEKKTYLLMVFTFLGILNLNIAVLAQEAVLPVTSVAEIYDGGRQNVDDVSSNVATKSILFTGQEFSALREARNYTGSVRPFDDSFESFDEEEVLPLPPQDERFITLGGILYQSGKSWTIWLNGQRVTPDALPEEVLDLRVFKDYVEMGWYDVYTKRIIPIRLRSNQRFHMDARIFLPG